MFPNLKKRLRGQRFSTDEELKYAAKEWLKWQSEIFILQALKVSEFALLCFDRGGDYIEQEVKVIWQKAPHGGPIPRLGVTPGGRNLHHW